MGAIASLKDTDVHAREVVPLTSTTTFFNFKYLRPFWCSLGTPSRLLAQAEGPCRHTSAIEVHLLSDMRHAAYNRGFIFGRNVVERFSYEDAERRNLTKEFSGYFQRSVGREIDWKEDHLTYQPCGGHLSVTPYGATQSSKEYDHFLIKFKAGPDEIYRWALIEEAKSGVSMIRSWPKEFGGK